MVKKLRKEQLHGPGPVWKHNSLIGHARSMQVQCRGIWNAETTSETAKALAREIWRLAQELELNLRKERVDK